MDSAPESKNRLRPDPRTVPTPEWAGSRRATKGGVPHRHSARSWRRTPASGSRQGGPPAPRLNTAGGGPRARPAGGSRGDQAAADGRNQAAGEGRNRRARRGGRHGAAWAATGGCPRVEVLRSLPPWRGAAGRARARYRGGAPHPAEAPLPVHPAAARPR
eukprot:scaffold3828_cov103-Isochrysis_galbana.AAC.2